MNTPVTEEWRPVLGGLYEASNVGRVRRAMPGRSTWPGRILNCHRLPHGYMTCSPTIDGHNVGHLVHQLVAEAFLGPCPDGYEVNHKDGNKANNQADNLEYVTRSGNMQHAIATGLAPHMVKRPRPPRIPKPRHILRGEEHWTRHKSERIARGEQCGHKVTQAQVDEIRTRVALGAQQNSLCADYGLSPAQICRIVRGKRWTSKVE